MKNWVIPSLKAKSEECEGVTRSRVTLSTRETKYFKGLDAGLEPKRSGLHLDPDLMQLFYGKKLSTSVLFLIENLSFVLKR